MKLSVAVITYNEEKNIKRFLNSVSDIADEIVITDSFSTDRTEEIARNNPKVKFIQKDFVGYGKQKNFAISQCNGEWILFPDTDEIIDEKAKSSILKIINENQSKEVFLINFDNILLGKTLNFGGWGKVSRERFFKNGSAKYSEDDVHESFITSSEKGILEGRIKHYTYRNIHHHIEKSNYYTSMMAEQMFRKGKKSSIAKIFFKPTFQFFKTYVLKAGFLDGWVGFYIAITAAFYTFLKYSKLYEKNKNLN